MCSRFPFHPRLKRLARILLILLLVLVLIIVSGVTLVEIRRHQALVLPAPTGPYAVGRIEYDWTNQSRTDLLGLLGSIDGVRGLQITRAYVRAFFDTYLNNEPSSLLQGPSSAYSEVQFASP